MTTRLRLITADDTPETRAKDKARRGLTILASANSELYRAGLHREADEASRLQLELARLFAKVGE